MDRTGPERGLIPATPSPRVARVFAWYAERLLRRSFHAVRATPGSVEAADSFGRTDGPGILLLSHCSWWDPILAAFLWRRSLRGRPMLAPMDRRELERFRFMRRLGIFGIDPDDRRSLRSMVDYVQSSAGPRTIVALTPQGRFTDVRAPMVLRPGAAAIAARLEVSSALVVVIEYGFWNDKRPEVFLRAVPVAAPASCTVAAWHRVMEATMAEAAETLAAEVQSRDVSRFDTLLGSGASVHPVYDWWLRLRGKERAIEDSHRRQVACAEGVA